MNKERAFTSYITEEGITRYRCVCGHEYSRSTGVGLWNVTQGGLRPENKNARHKCPCHPRKLLNQRVLLCFEPVNGFHASAKSAYSLPEGEALANVADRFSAMINGRTPDHIICESVYFYSKDDFASKLKEVAKKYAFFETYFVILGHGNEIGSLIADAEKGETLSAREMISRINKFYTVEHCLEHARIQMIYFAFCSSGWVMDHPFFAEQYHTKRPKSLQNTAIIGVRGELCANNFDLIDSYWILQALLSKFPLKALEMTIPKLIELPLVPERVLTIPEALSQTSTYPLCTEYARQFDLLKDFDGVTPSPETLYSGYSYEDGVLKH